MPDEILFERYLLALRKTLLDEKTEHTDRLALQVLLQAFADEAGPSVSVQHEPKRVEDKGAPDFKVKKGGLILGYVENKAIRANLENVLKSEQIARYKSLSQNIVLTDYLHFIWLSKDGLQRESLCHVADLENPKFRLHEDRILAVSRLLRAFFSTAPAGVGRAQELALALATRSQLLRDYLGEELIRQERNHTEARLYGLFEVFRSQVFHELTLKEFADAFAQMLAYGLFLARLNSNAQMITLHNAREYVPGSFRLIRELIDFLTELQKEEYRDVRWVVEEVLSIVNGLDLFAIHEDLSFRNRSALNRRVRAKNEEEWRLFSRDPFVYFYEDYLAKYDKDMKKARGVYYTPPPVVNFIVRAIDGLLKDTFSISSGLADHNRVTVLDFACGTGTFLVEVLQQIFDNIGPGSAKHDLIVREHVLKNIFGFEYLIAPYTIAHLKLSQYLKDKDYNLADTERFLIYLTNTLEPIDPQSNFLLPALTAESKEAQAVKDRNILVITGNPPYAGHSKNPSERIVQETVREIRRKDKVFKLKNPRVVQRKVKTSIGKLIEDYKFVDGKPLGEQNSKWLQDDYVKFIRFAQKKMEGVEEGVVGIITNHSYLDNPTFRGMRQSLTNTFNQIYIIDLHGSIKPKETAPEGLENENVFDIQKGVAIALFVKKPGAPKGVWYSEFWGTRLQKYRSAAETEFRTIAWQEVKCFSPYYMFRPLDWSDWDAYRLGWSIADSLNPIGEKQEIFSLSVLGFQTHRDDFSIAAQRSDIESRVSDMVDGGLSDAEFANKYFLKSNRDWTVREARAALRANDGRQKNIIRCAYRPFDNPYCYFGHEFMDYPRRELLDHVAWRDNIQLLVARQIGVANWRHVLASDVVAESCCISDGSTEQNYVFPLYLYPLETKKRQSKADLFAEAGLPAGKERIDNFTPKFREWLGRRYECQISPEAVLGYIYAVLHAPTYRRKYEEYLRIDFPRVSFPATIANFETLSVLGWALLEAHLLRKIPSLSYGRYLGKGDHMVGMPRYIEAEEAVYINDLQHFAPVPMDVWNFHIGGYQVIDKYLKSRRGQKLTLDEIDNVANMADILAFTTAQMERIDCAYLMAFRN
jgi:Type ISP C-terminal specificity domain/N-6 DNA Methylase